MIRRQCACIVDDGGAPAGEAEGNEEEESLFMDLPAHTFKRSDPIVFRHARRDGTVPDIQVRLASQLLKRLPWRFIAELPFSVSMLKASPVHTSADTLFFVQTNEVPLQGSIISMRRNFIKVAVTPEVHRELLDVPEGVCSTFYAAFLRSLKNYASQSQASSESCESQPGTYVTKGDEIVISRCRVLQTKGGALTRQP